MGVMILALCLFAGSPEDLGTTGVDTVTDQATQSSDAVSMPEYMVDQIIWWQYYGEWAPAPQENPETAKSEASANHSATAKTSI